MSRMTLDELQKHVRRGLTRQSRELTRQAEETASLFPGDLAVAGLGTSILWAIMAGASGIATGVEGALLASGAFAANLLIVTTSWFFALLVIMRTLKGALRVRVAWLSALVVSATLWMIFFGGMLAPLVASGAALLVTPLLGRKKKAVAKVEADTEDGFSVAGFPESVCRAVEVLPDELPEDGVDVVNQSLSAYLNLRDLLAGEATRGDGLIDPKAVMHTAGATLALLIGRLPLLAKLSKLQATQPDDDQIAKSRADIISQVTKLKGSLEAAVAAATRYITSETVKDASDLASHIENLQVMAEVREEVEGGDKLAAFDKALAEAGVAADELEEIRPPVLGIPSGLSDTFDGTAPDGAVGSDGAEGDGMSSGELAAFDKLLAEASGLAAAEEKLGDLVPDQATAEDVLARALTKPEPAEEEKK